jgi:hypothetical protein
LYAPRDVNVSDEIAPLAPPRWTAKRWVVAAALAGGLALLGARAFNPYTGIAPHIDSGVYLGVAEHLLHGRVLYRQVWDHKPPLVHALDALALAAGDHTVNAVRTMEIGWAAVAAVAMLAAGILAFDHLGVAALASILFLAHFYHPNVMRGNQPEEYGAILALLGIAFTLGALATPGRRSLALAATSGLLFGLACLAKETFVLGVPPWPALLFWAGPGDRRAALRRALAFAAGLLAPLAAFALYLLWNGAFGDWVNVLRFNLSYVRFDAANAPNPGLPGLLFDGLLRAKELIFGLSPVAAGAALLGGASALSPSFRRRTGWFPVALIVFFLLNLAGVSLARRYAYYFLQLVPAYVLLAGCGLAYLAFLARARRGLGAGLLAVITVGVVAASPHDAAWFARAVSQPRAYFHGDDALSAFIDANTKPDEPIWDLVRNGSAIYAEARRLAPTRFIWLSGWLLRDLPRPRAAVRELHFDLAAHPPRLVVFDGDEAELSRVGLLEWFRDGYTPAAMPSVFVQKSVPVAGPDLVEPPTGPDGAGVGGTPKGATNTWSPAYRQPQRDPNARFPGRCGIAARASAFDPLASQDRWTARGAVGRPR